MGYLNTNVLSHDLIPPHVNFSHLTAKDYNEMYRVIMTVKEGHFKELGLDACLLEDELNKVPGGTPGRASPIASPRVDLGHMDVQKQLLETRQGWRIQVPVVLPSTQGSFRGGRSSVQYRSSRVITSSSPVPDWDFLSLKRVW